jgi:hypothetical protein
VKKFLAMYIVPAAVMTEWSQKSAEERRPAEEKMRAAWGAWMGEHAAAISGTEVAGKTKRVSAEGISDVKNDVMLYAFVEAESHEAAAKMFQQHPHLQIPQSSIEVMEVRPM